LDDSRKASPDAKQPEQGLYDDDDDGDGESGPITAQSYFQTKNEVTLVEIPIPNIDTVGPEEHLEKVGEIINIIDNVAIIKGSGSEVGNRRLEKVLDSETLLVFEDRKVMGYVGVSALAPWIH
jgi:H/ACA ribonucleoprotein complex non-core subunit NAF1